MSGYRLTVLAAEDVNDIWEYIARNDISAADRLVQAIREACALLSQNPSLGHLRPDLTALKVRFFTVKKYYLLVYEPVHRPLTVLRVLHGARDVASLLGP